MDDTSVPFLNLAALEEGAGLVVRTFDETGAMICEYDARCPAPESGRGTFMLAHAPNSPLTEASYRVSMWDLASTSGCAPGPGRRWDAELAVGDFSSHSEVDCWWVDSVPGDQLVTGFATRLTGIYQAFFLDESNQDPCPHNYAACQAGPQRYRFMVVNGASASQPVQLGPYGLAIRSLTPDAGCVPIRPLEFGEAPSDRHRGIGCRSFMATPGATYHLTTHDLTNTPERLLRLTEVYDAQGQPACEFQVIVESCTTDNGGRLTVVTDPAYADTLTSLYNLDSSAGCRPWTVGGLSYVVGRLSLGQVDCHLVAPSGEAPPLIQVPDTGSEYLRPTVLDAQDNVVCQHERACALSGVGSHRVLLGGRYAGNGYLVVGAESGVPRSCPELRYGGANGVLVRTTAQSPVVCVRIQGVPTERPDAIHYRRVGGSGLGALGGLPSTAVLPCYGDAPDLTYAPNGSWTCDVPTAPYSADLVLVGNGTDQAFYVSRTPGYTQESPVAGVTLLQNTQRPVITGKARPGNRLRASPGRWKPKPGAYQYVWKVAGTAVPGATGRSFKVRPAYLGKRVTVVVTAAAPNLFPASATSRGIRVTRP